ncbi:MAG: hypothetical protein HY820_06325 [Acidobacteria bacterium]|nr:hypothetical protein [Acidobacteriota bacterium]
MDKQLDPLIERVSKAFGTRLVSLILYGSAASDETRSATSDLNILCVLTTVTTRELKDAEPIFHWWRKQGNPSPLLLSESELRASTDCFPIEFHDMRERRKVLSGLDVIDGLAIDESFYRARVEYELRAKFLRLRQKAGGVMFDPDLLCRLLAESVSTFVLLARHALRLAGHPAPLTRSEILAHAVQHFGIDATPFQKALDLREGNLPHKQVDAVATLEQYMTQIAHIIRSVDDINLTASC